MPMRVDNPSNAIRENIAANTRKKDPYEMTIRSAPLASSMKSDVATYTAVAMMTARKTAAIKLGLNIVLTDYSSQPHG
jgi:hypothetical protein